MRFGIAFVFLSVLLAAAVPAANAQTAAPPASSFGTRPQFVVTKNDTYLLGPVQMIAPAVIDDVTVHPLGRYGLIFQKEAALPSLPVPPPGEIKTTGASALLLYDAKLHKVRTLWSRRADGGKHSIEDAKWIPGTFSAAVVAIDESPKNDDTQASDRPESKTVSTLLLFNVAKSSTPRTLATSTTTFFEVDVSPTKPLFVMREWEGQKTQMVNALTGTVGPPLAASRYKYALFPDWSADGKVAYGAGVPLPKTPDEKNDASLEWLAWDGQTPNAAPLSERPRRSAVAKKRPPPPLPLVLRTDALPVPSSAVSAVGTDKNAPAAVLHPLFLQAAPDAAAENGLSVSVLVAPDADKSYLMPDLSAVLYQSGGALYAVPLVRIPAAPPPKP